MPFFRRPVFAPAEQAAAFIARSEPPSEHWVRRLLDAHSIVQHPYTSNRAQASGVALTTYDGATILN